MNTDIDKVLRCNVAGLQVPRVTFTHPDKPDVVFQGMVHIGTKSFYEKVIQRSEEFDGEVHLEGVQKAEDNPQAENLMAGYNLLANMVGVSPQKEIMSKSFFENHKDKDKFKFNDIDYNEVDYDFDTSLKELSEMDPSIFSRKKQLALMFNPLTLFFVLNKVNDKESEIDNDEVIVHKRDQVAFKHTVETTETLNKKVMLVWGAKHLHGMSFKFLHSGYQISSVQWDTVIPWRKGKDTIPFEERKAKMIELHKKIVESVDKKDCNVDCDCHPKEEVL